MSDSYFIGTVLRVHGLVREDQYDNSRNEAADKGQSNLQTIGSGHVRDGPLSQVGIMVSLDHTMYFHNPRGFRADEWMLSEMESPWSDDGRGLVFQRIYSQRGTLIATCVQEVRGSLIKSDKWRS